MKLNEITTLVDDKTKLNTNQVEQIKEIFTSILQSGERYDVDDIESWFENEGSWKNQNVIVRLTNLSHYVQDKYEQTARLKIISDSDDSCCGS